MSTKESVIRPFKGASVLSLIDNYTAIDLETTGLDSKFDSIIEICAIRIRGHEIAEQKDWLINPKIPLSDYIKELTGITDEMLHGAPIIEDIIGEVLDFIGCDVLIAHNANFDINFLYDVCEQLELTHFTNHFIDTMRMAKRIFPDLPHHRLVDLVDLFGIADDDFHRADSDALYAFQCYELMKQYCIGNDINLSTRNSYAAYSQKINYITSDRTNFDITNPFYGMQFVFTGALERMTRIEAAQIVADFGGNNHDTITKHTNYLVLGNNDYCSSIKGWKSNKQKKAEEYRLKGLPIQIISENIFYDMIEEAFSHDTE